MSEGDVYLSPMRGGSGIGDPLERDPAAVAADVAGGYLIERLADSVYGVVLGADGSCDPQATERRRAELRAERERAAQPFESWYAQERERVLAHAREDGERFHPAIQRMYAESMRLSPAWAAEYREFWGLPDDFGYDAATPTVEISERLLEGRDPEELQRQPRTDVRLELPERRPARSEAAVNRETLEALIDGELPDTQVRQIQSGYKDAERFDTYLAIVQDRWPFPEDRVLLPFGLHLCIVELPSGERVIKSRSGHVFGDYRENWKRNALVRVRDSREALLEIYPDKMHPDPEWNEIREYYDPGDMTLLDVESVPPGYPAVHDFLPDLEAFYRDWLGKEL
jgi:acetone carboxylase gamma subunit